METPPAPLTTAGEILDAYLSGLLVDVVGSFKTRPMNEFVLACAARGRFDLAVVLLDRAYYRNPQGSLEDRELAKAGLEILNPCLQAERWDIAEWVVNRAADIYPAGTTEYLQVMEKRAESEKTKRASQTLGTRSENPAAWIVTVAVKNQPRTGSPATVAIVA